MKKYRTKTAFIVFFTIILMLTNYGCSQRDGCTDSSARNYNPKAENDDGSCEYDQQDFLGTWKITDTIYNSLGGFEIRNNRLNISSGNQTKTKLKLLWNFSNGTYSDTIDGNLVTKAISIPLQSFNDTSDIKGSVIYMFYLGNTERILLRYIQQNAGGEIDEIKGIGER